MQRNSSYSVQESTIPFELARINVGKVMNVKTGVFTAPKEGIYCFPFFGIKEESDNFYVLLRKNENPVKTSIIYDIDVPRFSPYGLQSVLRLREGDEIDLYLWKGILFDTDAHLTHFIAGYLIE